MIVYIVRYGLSVRSIEDKSDKTTIARLSIALRLITVSDRALTLVSIATRYHQYALSARLASD